MGRSDTGLAAVLIGMLLLAGCGRERPSGGARVEAGDLSVRNAVVWPTADMATLGLRVTARRDDALVGVRVGRGGTATLHTVGPGGRGMPQVSEVALPAGREVVLTEGGPHVMIMGLERELQPGDSLEVVLRFRRGGDLRLLVPVARYTEAVRTIGPP